MVNFLKKNKFSIASFFVPLLVVVAYYASRQMSPFGHSSILTVDLGQQYIDMFSGFKHSLLQNPNSIFYSFTKNFGGEMFSEWAYYLLSPLNVVFLFFNQENLPIAIFLLVILRAGISGLMVDLFLRKTKLVINDWLIFAASITYALSGWFTANQVNLLWQDDVIFYPLLLLLLYKFVENQKKFLPFILFFSFILIDNFYIGYMIGLSLPLWALWFASFVKKMSVKRIAIVLISMVGSILISAVVLIPTAYQLLLGKGQDTVKNIDWHLIENPLYTFFKLIPGSFNFDEMQHGFANWFVPIIILFGVIAFFFNETFSKRTKIISLLFLVFYGASFVWNPMILLQHMLQMPVWYPYRFSFIPILFLIVLGFIGLQSIRSKMQWFGLGLSATLFAILVIFAKNSLKQATFINQNDLEVFFIFGLASLALFFVRKKYRYFLVAAISLISVSLNF
ncbi:MAG: YfhO family protein, partial [Lactobacillaceae bacterium]|nr:YfhO family protein [Lactobacillaceae bacterium]